MIQVAVMISVFLGLLAPALSQDLPKAERRENAAYYEALFVKFKPGKADEAYGYIYDHFVKADQKIGRKVMAFDLQTGDWDMVVFFPLKEGVAELNWSTTPTDEAWWKALAEQAGGAEKAQSMFQAYLETVAFSKSEVAHTHNEAFPQ